MTAPFPAALAVAAALAASSCSRPWDDPSDLGSGTRLICTFDHLGVVEEDRAIESVKRTIADRFDVLGIRDLRIRTRPGRRMVEVQVPAAAGSRELERLRRLCERQGILDIAPVAPPEEQTPARIAEVRKAEEAYRSALEEWAAGMQARRADARAEGKREPEPIRPVRPDRMVRARTGSGEAGGSPPAMVLQDLGPNPLNRMWIRDATVRRDGAGRPAIDLALTEEGVARFAPFEGRLVAVLGDGGILFLARMAGGGVDRATLAGDFSEDEARDFVVLLMGGSFMAAPDSIDETPIGSPPPGGKR
jgi:hypothetical protein